MYNSSLARESITFQLVVIKETQGRFVNIEVAVSEKKNRFRRSLGTPTSGLIAWSELLEVFVILLAF